jgi:hypothetical protein
MTVGKIIRLMGWGIVAYALVTRGYGYFDISSDASVRAYAFLVLIEGGIFALLGLGVVWLGRRLERREAAKQGEG